MGLEILALVMAAICAVLYTLSAASRYAKRGLRDALPEAIAAILWTIAAILWAAKLGQ